MAKTIEHLAADLEDQVIQLKQAVWDAYGILGFDQDGQPTPAALTHPPMPDFVRQFATEARKEIDEQADELSDMRSAFREIKWLMSFSDGVSGLRIDGTLMPWAEVRSLYLPMTTRSIEAP